MGLQNFFHAIFIWPILLLFRGVSSPFFALGRLLLRWLFYSRRRSSNGINTPAHNDDGSSTADNRDNNQISTETSGCFNQQYTPSSSGNNNLKFRNRPTPSSLLRDQVVSSDPQGSSAAVPRDLPTTFYAINVLPQTLEGNESPHLVFQDKGTVLKEIKKYKGARFKSFTTKEEAISYTKYVPENFGTTVQNAFQIETASNNINSAVLEKSNWKAPKGPDLVNLRKKIESGDYQSVQDTINSNPRFLISCGDTPAILHEGPRYNALHIAAKNNQAEIIKLYIQTIEDPSFFLKLYGQSQEDQDTRNERVMKLLDLYLNTPDKGFCETPLHFACKFGYKDVVEVLMSHSLTESNPKNKFGETPADLICKRVDKPSNKVETDIKQFLEGRCYVPLYRDEDNIVSPTVGKPCSPSFSPDIFSPPFTVCQMKPFSPEAPVLSPKAFAGPMSPSQADRFRKQWRSPCSRNEQVKEAVREDHEKGYERIGRNLALENSVPWSEYWGFLDRFTDLSKPSGIELLEDYLQKQNLAMNVQSSLEAIQHSSNHFLSSRQIPTTSRLQSMKNDLFSDIDDSKTEKEAINDDSITFEQSLPCSSTLPTQSMNPVKQMDISPSSENGTIQNNQHDNSDQKELSFQEENLEEIINTLAKDFGTKLIIMSPDFPSDDKSPEKLDIKMNKKENVNYLFPLKDEFTDMLNAVQNNQEPLSVFFMTQASCDKPTYPSLSHVLQEAASPKGSTIAEKRVVLNIKSPKNLIVQVNAMPAKSPPKLKNKLKVFIQGPAPTKLDVDVQRCLQNVQMDSKQFPYTAKWLELMNTFTEKEQKSWPSPAKGFGKEAKSKDGTPVMKSHTIRQLQPTNLFKSPSTNVLNFTF